MNTKSGLIDSKNSTRKSGIELLKIIALFVICVYHCTQTASTSYFNIYEPTTNVSYIIMRLLGFGGNIGNLIFIISSSYFLLESNRFKKEKVVNIFLDSQFISISIFFAYLSVKTVFKMSGTLSFRFIMENLFPDLYSKVWFIPAYILLYIAHPYLNRIIRSLTQKELFTVCAVTFTFFGIFEIITENEAYYGGFFRFVLVYFVVAYMKLYCSDFVNNRKKNLYLFIILFVVLLAVAIGRDILSLHINFFVEYPHINGLTSVFLFPMTLCLFNVFLKSDFKSAAVNKLSSCSLFVYCIHENYIVRSIIRLKFYNIVIGRYGEGAIVIYILILAVALFVGSYIISLIYQHTLHKLTQKLSVKLYNYISSVIDKKLLRFNNQ